MRPIRSILVPVDFSDGSAAAVEAARSLAAKLSADLEILHVWEGAERPMPSIVVDVEDGTASRLMAEARTHGLPMERATMMFAELASQGLRFRARFESGNPAEAIARVVEECGHDLVVMGTHGRTGVRRLVLGSVAETVVRTCPVPVLTVRADGERAQWMAGVS